MIARLLGALRREPVRVTLYGGVIVPTAGYLVAKGRIQADDAAFYLALAAAVLGVETARTKVEPLAKRKVVTVRHVGGPLLDGAELEKALNAHRRRSGRPPLA